MGQNCDGNAQCVVSCDHNWDLVVTVTSGGDYATDTVSHEGCFTSPSSLSYATLDQEALQNEIDAAMASLQSDRGSDGATSSETPAQTLRRLYRLLHLQARVEQVRAGSRQAQTNALTEERSQVRTLVTGLADAAPGSPESLDVEVQNVARQILVDNLLRSGQPGEALQRTKTYLSNTSTGEAYARMLLLRALAFGHQGKIDQALAAIDRAEKRWPEGIGYASTRIAVLHLNGASRGNKSTKQQQQTTQAAKAVGAETQATTQEVLPQTFALDAPYPNPSSGRVTVPLALPERAQVNAALYDMLGRRVQTVEGRTFAAGQKDLLFSAKGLSSGVYLIHVNVETASGKTHILTEKVAIVR